MSLCLGGIRQIRSGQKVHKVIQTKNTPSRGISKFKDPEIDIYLTCSRDNLGSQYD